MGEGNPGAAAAEENSSAKGKFQKIVELLLDDSTRTFFASAAVWDSADHTLTVQVSQVTTLETFPFFLFFFKCFF